MNTDLFRAVLALDSYNRGYGDGLGLKFVAKETEIGNARIYTDSTIEFGQGKDSSIGFYGIAYEMLDGSGRGTGEKIISYRGTDRIFSWPWSDSGSDMWNAYTGAIGGLPSIDNSDQSGMAISFYKSVIGNENPYWGNVSFTGHSLGGGLAGARRDDQKAVY